MNTTLLRATLRANAVFSLASGALAISFADEIALGLAIAAPAFVVIGLMLIGYGVALALLSLGDLLARPWTVLATALDLAWVAGSVILLLVHDAREPMFVVLPGVMVLLLAMLQLEGIRRVTFTTGVGRFLASRMVLAAGDRAWAVISDVAHYAQVAGTLHRSEIISGHGVGMVRKCEDKAGACWLETCTRWEPGKAYTFEVDTSGPDYPLPLRRMAGDFEVEARGPSSCVVLIRFTFEARGGWATEIALALMFAVRGSALVGSILDRWAAQIEASASHEDLFAARKSARS